jgi:xylose isomerase
MHSLLRRIHAPRIPSRRTGRLNPAGRPRAIYGTAEICKVARETRLDLTLHSPRFATRLNSFASRADLHWPGQAGKPDVLQMAERASRVQGLTHLDLNYPDHAASSIRVLSERLADLGLAVNGLAMRYYTNPAFRIGAFTNPDPAVRREAIDLTRRGIDATREAGADLMTLWLGQDGFETPFQANYAELWDMVVDGIRTVADHDPACRISIEYKPNEPRAFSVLPDAATTLLAIREAGSPNLGVTLDFAHVLYADEQPAMVATLIARHSRLFGVHLNDGYGKRDDGLMVGVVHIQQTVELLSQIRRDGYDGVIYFDTFPDASGLDPVRECEVNIAAVKRMLAIADRLDADPALRAATRAQDAVAAQAVVQAALFGGG